jgi:hypothetical protein
VLSDRNAKTDFRPLDASEVLRKVAALPIQSWAYKTELGKPRHVGPVAQDFHAAFGLGSTDTGITEVDLAGINMTAIQALAAENQRLKQALADTNARLERLERALAKGRDPNAAK